MAKSRKAKRRGNQQRHAPRVAPRHDPPVQRVVGEVTPMPDPGGHLTLAPVTGLQRRALYVPVPALARVARVAEEEDLELRFPVAESEWRMESSAALAMATRVTGDDVDFVRAFVKVPLSEGGDDFVHRQAWMDLPTRYVAMMVEASTEQEATEPGPEQTQVAVIESGPKPTWAGSHVFDKLWKLAEQRIAYAEPAQHEADGTLTTAPAKVDALQLRWLLAQCHLVRVEASQMEVLPEWEDVAQAHDFAHDLNLPFDPLLLEFEGLGGVAPQMTVPMYSPGGILESVVVLRGALVSRVNVAGSIAISPFGDLYLPDVDDESDAVTVTAREKAKRGDDSSVHPYAMMGRVVFDADTEGRPLRGGQVVAAEATGSRRLQSVATAVNAELLGGPSNALVVLPHQYDESEAESQSWAVTFGLDGWAHAVYVAGLRALAALSIMESDFVVIDQAQMERRDVKRAEKRGWKIADQVYLRPVRKGSVNYGDGSGEHRNFSHRFWVRGHMKHFPIGTRLATARPDLVKPCTRPGVASCGMCRRVWTPPFIKGPEDKPLVMKSLVKKVE